MARFRLFIEYEGTRYSGWQVQKNARTVQGEILRVARDIFKTADIELYGSGRTDAGVHALCQVSHLEVKTMLAPEIIRMKLNDDLPADISLLEVEKAAPNFHARHDAVARSYLYQISRRRTALGKRYVWWIRDPLDLARMKSAAKLFTGMNDMRGFTADDPDEKSTSVLVEEIDIREAGDLILLRITGSHFLWRLARRIVGMLVEAGRGKVSEAELRKMIVDGSGDSARHTAPPSGLFLERVYYKGEKRLSSLQPVISVGSSST